MFRLFSVCCLAGCALPIFIDNLNVTGGKKTGCIFRKAKNIEFAYHIFEFIQFKLFTATTPIDESNIVIIRGSSTIMHRWRRSHKKVIHLGRTFSMKCCYIKSKNRHDSGLSDLFTSESAQHLINNILILDPIIFNQGCHSF